MKIKPFLFLLFTLILLPLLKVSANDASLGRTPEGVYLLNHADVEMLSEDIKIYVEKGLTDCTFTFKNNGDETDVLMGFPATIKNFDEAMTTKERISLNNFTASVKDIALPVKLEKGIKINSQYNDSDLQYDEWYTFNIRMKKNETVIVKNTYTFNSTLYSTGHRTVGYILKTGKTWNGLLGHTKVTFYMGNIRPYDIETINPGGYYFEGNDLVFEKYNYKPEYDLSIYYNTRKRNKEFLEQITDDEKQKFIHEIEDNENYLKTLNSSSQDRLMEEYKKAYKEKNTLMCYYIKSKLPKYLFPEVVPVINDIKIDKRSSGYGITLMLKDENLDLAYASLDIKPVNIVATEKNSYFFDWEYFSAPMDVSLGTICNLLPDTDYKITATAKDSNNNIVNFEKSFSTIVKTSSATPTPAVSMTTDNSNTLTTSPTAEKKYLLEKDNYFNKFYITFIILGIFLVGIFVISFSYFKKRKRNL